MAVSDKRKSRDETDTKKSAKQPRTSHDAKSPKDARRQGKLDKSTAKSFVKKPAPAPIPQNK